MIWFGPAAPKACGQKPGDGYCLENGAVDAEVQQTKQQPDSDERLPSLADPAARDRGRSRGYIPAEAVGGSDPALANGAATGGLWLRHRPGRQGGDGDPAWDHLRPVERYRHPSRGAHRSPGIPTIPQHQPNDWGRPHRGWGGHREPGERSSHLIGSSHDQHIWATRQLESAGQPARSLLFDIVDFDKTYPATFGWELNGVAPFPRLEMFGGA